MHGEGVDGSRQSVWSELLATGPCADERIVQQQVPGQCHDEWSGWVAVQFFLQYSFTVGRSRTSSFAFTVACRN